MANRLRRDSLISTAEAGSGHPTSSMSAADLVAVLFFHFLRFDVKNPKNPHNDRFILSKGHAAPVLWAAWAEAGAFPVEKLKTLRRIDSELEGHPTPRSPYADVATGSLGQGLSDGLGMALAFRMDKLDNRAYVLLGDGEVAEGAVWEAAELASYSKLDNLIAILDANRLGQSQQTMIGHDVAVYEERFKAFGWHTQVIDGHNIEQILEAFETALGVTGQPSILIARTIKGKGVSFLEDKDGWHGKPVKKGPELDKALKELGDNLELKEPLLVMPPEEGGPSGSRKASPSPAFPPPEYKADEEVATRKGYGNGLKKLGEVNPQVVALDGDVENSSYSEYFAKAFPERFVECFIAEQNMIGVAVGLSAMGKIPFASTFACFLTRAFDQIRMGAISRANLKLCGSHAGVSIGEDGPSQMGLEDLAMMRAIYGSTVFYPSDAVAAERLVELAARTAGIVYLRTTRAETPILYGPEEEFTAGGCKVLRSSREDRATLIGAGITLHEALKAYETLQGAGIHVRVIDLYSVKPLDARTLLQAAQETGVIVTVEDHYPEGGLGDAVLGVIVNEDCIYRKLAVSGLPRSGKPAELLEMFGISAGHIVAAVKELL